MRAAFPGYLFIAQHPMASQFIDDESSGLYSWLRVVRNGLTGVGMVSAELIEDIRQREAAGEFNTGEPGRPEFTGGELVEVEIGGTVVKAIVARKLKSGKIRLAGLWAPITVDADRLHAIA